MNIVIGDVDESGWDRLKWRRRLETFGDNDTPVSGTGPKGQVDALWYVTYSAEEDDTG